MFSFIYYVMLWAVHAGLLTILFKNTNEYWGKKSQWHIGIFVVLMLYSLVHINIHPIMYIIVLTVTLCIYCIITAQKNRSIWWFSMFILGLQIVGVVFGGLVTGWSREIFMSIILVNDLVCYYVMILTEKMDETNHKIILSKSVGFIFYLIPVLSEVLIIMFLKFNLPIFYMLTVLLFLIMVNGLLLIIFVKMNTLYQSQIEAIALQNQVMRMKEGMELVKSSRHEMRNILNAMQILAKEENSDEILTFLENNDLIQPIRSEIQTGNYRVDEVLNYQIQRGKDCHIEYRIKVNIPEDLKLDIFDLAIVLGNLLENALEAVSKIKDEYQRWILLNMSFERGVLYVTVENPYIDTIVVQGEVFLTSKEDYFQHGCGLKNVRNIVDKNQGMIKINTEKMRFRVDLMMYVKEEESI